MHVFMYVCISEYVVKCVGIQICIGIKEYKRYQQCKSMEMVFAHRIQHR